MVDLEYLKMSPPQRLWFNFKAFFKRLPLSFAAFFKAIPKRLYKLWLAFAGIFLNIGRAAKDGDWKTRTSFAVMGFGSCVIGVLNLGFLKIQNGLLQ